MHVHGFFGVRQILYGFAHFFENCPAAGLWKNLLACYFDIACIYSVDYKELSDFQMSSPFLSGRIFCSWTTIWLSCCLGRLCGWHMESLWR